MFIYGSKLIHMGNYNRNK